jgi:prepilin-type N-terminal cleavage/methylation domain-containing protein
MPSAITKRRKRQQGFSLLEMMFATIILLVGLVAIAQLVPATILLNYRNRMDSSALVLAQRQLDQFLDQPLTTTSFTDVPGTPCALGCSLGDPTQPNQVLPDPSVVIMVNNQPVINFNAAKFPGYHFDSPPDGNGVAYDIRWAVVITGDGSTASAKRFILGARQSAGTGYFQPITLDSVVQK